MLDSIEKYLAGKLLPSQFCPGFISHWIALRDSSDAPDFMSSDKLIRFIDFIDTVHSDCFFYDPNPTELGEIGTKELYTRVQEEHEKYKRLAD